MSSENSCYEYYSNKADKAEEEVAALCKVIEELRAKLQDDVSEIPVPAHTEISGLPSDLAELVVQNVKLSMRLSILNRSIEEERSAGIRKPEMQEPRIGSSILETMKKLFTCAIMRAFPDLPEVPISVGPSTNSSFGDYQCNSAMGIAKLLKSQGIKMSPREVADKLLSEVPEFSWVEKMEIAGAGYINVWLSRELGLKALNQILCEGVQPPPLERKHIVAVDFSSPNIAKEMHVGHLRSTIIGDSICRLLEFLGHDVHRINHVGDWGTQFGMLIAHLQDQYPDFREKSPPIADLQAFYKESKKRFDEDADFKSRAYSCVVKLQSFDPDYTKAWQLICDVSRKEFQKVYDRLGISLKECGESFYQSRMVQLVKELEERGFLEEDEGRKIMWGPKDRIPFTIVKSDGGFTYDTSDMATIRYRAEELKADWLIYVTDAGQATHFEILKHCAERAGFFDSKRARFDHVPFGVVLGEDKKKFKTRSGETVKLVELLDEGVRRADEKLKEKGRDQALTEEELQAAREAVAYGCIKYADLSHNRTHDYVFSFDKMLEDKGNTAVYLLYMLTRIRSIGRLAGYSPESIREAAKQTAVSLDHEKEWKLAKILMQMTEVLAKITQDLCLHHICEYVYSVSTAFSEFYDNCYCVEKDPQTGEIIKIRISRLLLCEATAMVMEKCFSILGLTTVSKM